MKTRESLYWARVTAILVALVSVANGLLLGAFYSDAERAVIGEFQERCRIDFQAA